MNRLLTVAALAVGGMLLSKQLGKSRASGMMSSTMDSIDVNVPVHTAYNQWTQFEELPKFMDSVHEIRQIDDTHLHWRASVAGKEEEWDAEITEQIPDKRIAWRSTGGVRNAGVVTFHKLTDNTTRVTLQMDYDPQSFDEKVGDALGLVKMQLSGNLKRYKELLEGRGQETGAWRGTVPQH
jgi:uncharacterized membrane protein